MRLTFVSIVAWFVFATRALGAGLDFAGVPLTPGTTVSANVPLSALEKSYVTEAATRCRLTR